MNVGLRMVFTSEFAARCLSLARKLFIPIALGFLAYSVYRASDHLAPLLATLSARYLLLAWLCWCAAQWVGPLGTMAVMRILNLHLGYRELSLISVLRLPARYLPGGIWQSVARFTAYSQRNVSSTTSLSILVAEHLFALGVSVAIGALLLIYVGNTPFETEIATYLLVGAFLLLFFTAFWVVRMGKRKPDSAFWVVNVISSAALFWAIASTAFCIYWTAMGFGEPDVLRVAACYLLSWAAGFVAVFAPQGLGVFEWVAAHLLQSAQPASVVVTAIAGFRLVTIGGDLSAWAIGLVISRTGAFSRRAGTSTP